MIKRFWLILSIATMLCAGASAQSLDSIARLIPGAPDSLKLKYLDILAFEHENLDSIMKYSKELYDLSDKLNDNNYKYNALLYFGYVYYYRDDMEEALHCYYSMLELAEKSNSHRNKGISYRKIATTYSQLGNYNQSDNYYTKALNEYRIIGDSSKIASVLRYQGYTYIDFNVFQMGNNNFREALRIDQARHDTTHIVEDLFNIGRAQYLESVYLSSDSLLECAKNTLIHAYFINFSNTSTTMKTHILKYMVNIFTDKSFNARNAEERAGYADSLKFYINLLNEKRNTLGMNNVEDFITCEASYEALNGNFAKAIEILDKINEGIKDDEKKYNTSYTDLCHAYLLIYKTLGDYKNALKYTNLLLEYERKKRSQDFLVSASNNKYEEELSERKASEKLLEVQVKDQKKITGILVIFIITAVLMIAIIGMALARNKRNSKKIGIQYQEIARQRDLLENARRNTMSALVYAERIQKAALPEVTIFQKAFSDFFVILHPLNIVSGDFYWAATRRELTFAAVGDCTGHGVPGAFLSMLSISSLNDIILSINYEEITASAILNTLRDKIIKSLHQTTDLNSSSDGLDISLIAYHKIQNKMQYAGAHRPLWIIQNGQFSEIKGDRQPVGIHLGRRQPFTCHEIDTCPGDTIYMFSDGITDQIDSSPDHNKYSLSQLKNKIMETASLQLKDQKEKLDEDFLNWRQHPDGSMENQLDDQILLAIRL